MDNDGESFTQRMLRRASRRKQQNDHLNLNADNVGRRLSILQAIGPRRIARNELTNNKQAIDCENDDCIKTDDEQRYSHNILTRNKFTRSDSHIILRRNVSNYYSGKGLNRKPFAGISESMIRRAPESFNTILKNDKPNGLNCIHTSTKTRNHSVFKHNPSARMLCKSKQSNQYDNNLSALLEAQCVNKSESLNVVGADVLSDSVCSDDCEDPNFLVWTFFRNKCLQGSPDIYNSGPKSLDYFQVNCSNFLQSNNDEILPNNECLTDRNSSEHLNQPPSKINTDLSPSGNKSSCIHHELQNDVKPPDGSDNTPNRTCLASTESNVTDDNSDIKQDSKTDSLPSSSDSEKFKLDIVKWRKSNHDTVHTLSKKEKSNCKNVINFDYTFNNSSKFQTKTEPQWLEVEYKYIKIASEMKAELVVIEDVPDSSININNISNQLLPQNCSISSEKDSYSNLDEDKISLSMNNLSVQEGIENFNKINSLSLQNNAQEDSLQTASLTATIRALDAEIENLDFRPNVLSVRNMEDATPPNVVLPNQTNHKCIPTSYSPKVQHQFSSHSENNRTESTVVIISENSKSSKRSPNQVSNMEDKCITPVLKKNEYNTTSETCVKSKLNNTYDINSDSNRDSTTNLENALDKNVTHCNIYSNYNENINQAIDNFSEQVVQDKNKSVYSRLNIDDVSYVSLAESASLNPVIKPINHSPSCISEIVPKKTVPPSQDENNIFITCSPDSSKITENMQNPQNIYANQENPDNSIPYVVKNFLKDALGDEINNFSLTDLSSNVRDKTTVSENNILSHQGVKGALMLPVTESPLQHSGTFNRTLMMYRSFTQKIKKKFRPSYKAVTTSTPPTTTASTSTNSPIINAFSIGVDENKKVQELLREVDIQNTLMYQASKALHLCHSMKEFQSSPEQAESERLLLLAGLRKEAILREIKKIYGGENNNRVFCEQGMVTIKNMSLPLKENILKEEGGTGDFVQWFVIVILHGLTVWASPAITCPVRSSKINIPGSLTIPNLTPDFKIDIRIYSLKLPRVTYTYEEKYHLHKTEKRSACPSPKNLLKKTEKSVSPKQCQTSTIANASFVLSGCVELYLHDLTLVSPWPLMSVPKKSVLHGTLDLNLTCKLYLSISHMGFLTHCDEAGGFAVWNRRWCVLEGHVLMFWNYPRDQETKSPLLIIDLMHCISDEVTIVDRSLCAKPRTMLIETGRRRNAMDRNTMVVECRSACTVVRNLLSCDTAQELTKWMVNLNHVISALREWNVIIREQQLVSDL